MAAIEIKDLSKIYRKGFWGIKVPAVTELSFSVNEGGITGFVGPNGAGKTTTIKMIMGLVRPTKGNVFLYGKDASKPQSRKKIAYLSEQPYFYGHLTVSEALRFVANLIKLPQDIIKKSIDEVLVTVELTGKEKTKVKELSKGMQQRLNMAQALLGDPHTLILDEPMSGMDPPGRRLFRGLFSKLAQNGKTIFFSTHVLEDIESVCNEVVVLSKGKLSYSGGVAQLLAKGFLGTGMVVGGLDGEMISYLEKAGSKIIPVDTGMFEIFIPSGKDISAVQKYLASNDKYCESIEKRAMPLEELLYSNGGARL
jgi:ABC-2 type transport system ATP-binding protein